MAAAWEVAVWQVATWVVVWAETMAVRVGNMQVTSSTATAATWAAVVTAWAEAARQAVMEARVSDTESREINIQVNIA